MAKSERLEVRVDGATREAWQAEADERGVPLSELVRFAVNSECGRLAIANSEPLGSLTGVPKPEDPECPHPKGSRRSLGYATVCDDCGQAVR